VSKDGFERRVNVENAFSMGEGAAEKIKGKTILLVDDIYTTGSTASACAHVLMSKGARNVRVISFASGANLLKWDEETAQVCG